jgi:threonine dehydratase
VWTVSAGNAAQGVALAARTAGVPCSVMVMDTAPAIKVRAIEQLGATIVRATYDECWRTVEQHGSDRMRGLFLHPFDDDRFIAGNGSVGLEILEDLPDVDVVLVQVGGGGLVSGIATAVKGAKPDARVVAVEPERSRALHESLRAGQPVTVEAKSIADGLNGPYAGANCVAVCTALGVETALVSEDDLKEGFRFLYGRAKLACEVAGAATAAALLGGKVQLEPGDVCAAVVSGGNVAAQTASAILAER